MNLFKTLIPTFTQMKTLKTTFSWCLSALFMLFILQTQAQNIPSVIEVGDEEPTNIDVCNTIFYADHDANVNTKIYAINPDLESGVVDASLFVELPITDVHIGLNLDGTRLYTVSGKGNNELGYVDLATKTYTKVTDLKIGKVTQLAFAPSGYLYVTSNTDSKVYVIEDLGSPVLKDYGKISLGSKFIKINGADIAFTQSGKMILASSDQGGRFYEITGTQGNLQATELGVKRNKKITGIAIMDNGQGYVIYSARDKKFFTVLDVTTGEEVAKLTLTGDLDKGLWGDMSSSCMEYAEPPVLEGCTAVEIVSFNQGKTRKGKDVPADRSDEYKALGYPQGGDAKNSFVSLGFGGDIVLKFGGAIINGEGPDLQVVETSYGNPSPSKYPEKVQVYASQDGVNWVDLGSEYLDSEYDLKTLDWALYVKLVDITNPDDFKGNEDGFDVDGVTCIHGTMPIPTPVPPVVCGDLEITQNDLGAININNTHVKEAVVLYTVFDGNLEEVETGSIMVEGETSVAFNKSIPDNGKAVFLLGSDVIAGSLTTGEYCVVKTGTEIVDAGTRIDTVQVYEGKVYDARSWSWFNPVEKQVLQDLEGNTVAETDKGVSLSDLTVLTNETDMLVKATTGAIGYTHVVGTFIIDETGLPSQPQIIIEKMKRRQTAEGTIEGTIPAGSTFGFFLVAAHERKNPLIQNPGAEIRFVGTTLEYSTDDETWTAVPDHQIVFTIQPWNRRQTEQAIAGVVDLEDGSQALRVGFEDIAGGGDKDYEDIALTVYLSGVNHLKTKTTKLTEEVDVYTEIPCGECQVVIEGKKTTVVPPITCDEVEMTTDEEGNITFTNNAPADVIVSYDNKTVEIAAGTEVTIDDKAPAGGTLSFVATFKDKVSVEGEETCAVKVGTETITENTKVPTLVEVNGKVYDARDWEVFDLAERKEVSFVGGAELEPMDYGVSLSDLTTITEEANLQVDASVGGVGSLNFVGVFTVDATGQAQNPELLYLVNGSKTANVEQTIPANTLVGFFNISYKDKSLYAAGNLNYLRFKEGTHTLEASADGESWVDLSSFGKKIQVQYTIAGFNDLDGTDMTIGGVVPSEADESLLRVGFENNYYDDWDYEDIILTVHFSPEMVYETKIVTETKEVDIFAEVPCTGCTFEVEGPEIVEEPICDNVYDLAVYPNSVSDASVGDVVEYEVIVFNNGETAEGAILTAEFPDNVSVLSVTNDMGESFADPLNVPLGDMEAWAFTTLYYQVSIDEAPASGGNIFDEPGDGLGAPSGGVVSATFTVNADCGQDAYIEDNVGIWDIMLGGSSPPILFDANGPAINVYPNPFTDVLNVQFNNLEQTVISLTLRNNKGEIVYQSSSTMDNQFLVTANVSALPAGAYFLEVRTNNYSETFKLFKFE